MLARILLIFALFAFTTTEAKEVPWNQLVQYALLEQLRGFQSPFKLKKDAPYTVIDESEYRKVVSQSRQRLKKIIRDVQSHQFNSLEEKLIFIISQLEDTPYLFEHAMGEGDWQPASMVYQGNAIHIKQQPVYRLDGFDCQTFVQVAMGLLYATSLKEFDATLLKIAYGAANNPNGHIVNFYNRNHFIEGDFNPVNRKNGYLSNDMHYTKLASYTKKIEVKLTRKKWFKMQLKNLPYFFQVFSEQSGESLLTNKTYFYKHLSFPHFKKEKVTVEYIPKQEFLLKSSEGLISNQNLFNLLSTPAIIEVVRDSKRWLAGRQKVKDIIGSDLAISHIGLLYKQQFKLNETIYHKTTCDNYNNEINCDVYPVKCNKKTCSILMFAHATSTFPKNFSWIKKSNGQYACEFNGNRNGNPSCNRVVAMPFFSYLTDYQQGYYWMDNPSFIGFHVEKLNTINAKS